MSARFYVVIGLALLAVLSWDFANQYTLFHTKGLSEEALDGTKYVISDCGRVVFTDRTEYYQTRESSRSGIDYYVTYYSPTRRENHTLKVTPAAYNSANKYKEQGTKICFTVMDDSYHSDSLGYTFWRGLSWGSILFFVFQCAFWIREEKLFS